MDRLARMRSSRTIFAAPVVLIVLLLSTPGTGVANAANASTEVETTPPAQVSAVKVTILSTMLADAGITSAA
jgi:hypothetical protein